MTTVGFKLDPEGGKHFLERLTFERDGDKISIGVTKPNGDWYAWATLTETQLISALQLLEVIENQDEQAIGLPVNTKVRYLGTKAEGTIVSEPSWVQCVRWSDNSNSFISVDRLVPVTEKGD